MRDQNLAQSSYSSEISAPSFPELGKLRSAITRAVWRKRSSRSADVVLSLLHPVHRVDPAAAWAHLCLRQLRRMWLRRHDFVMLIRSLWESPCTKSKFGPITSAKRALDFLGWTWPQFEIFISPNRPPFRWLQHSRAFFQHQIREARASLKAADKRLDLRGIGSRSVDRHTLNRILRRFNDYQRGTFFAILAGGFCSAKQFCRAGLASDPTCPFCGQVEEDVEHIFLSCVAWSHIRLKFPHVSLDWLQRALPCEKVCAIPLLPLEVTTLPDPEDSEDEREIVIPLSTNDLCMETVKENFVIAFADGACTHQSIPCLRRAGFGVAFDKDLKL